MHLPLVKKLIWRKWGRTVSSHDLDDLYQAGCVGLLSAARRFDPSRGIKFSTYAQTRIIGAAIDQLREHRGRPGRWKVCPALDTDMRVDDGETRPMEIVAGDAATEDRRLAAVRREVLGELRRRFPIRTAQIAMAHVFDRRTLEDVSRDWEVTESRLKQLMGPIREQVRNIIERVVAREASA